MFPLPKSAPDGINPFAQTPEMWSMFREIAGTMEPIARSTMRAGFEMQSLAGQRANAYAEIPKTISRCRTPFDLMTAQIAFWQQASLQYQEASRRIMDVWQTTSRQSIARAAEMVGQRDYITFPEPQEERREDVARRAA